MKRLFTIVGFGFLMAACTCATAANPQPVRRFVKTLLGATQISELNSCQHNNASFKVYNQAQGQGFVIVANDNQIVGYSKEGQLTDNNLPEPLRQLLSDYQPQTETASTSRKVRRATSAIANWQHYPTDAVAPMLRTNWDQGYPYNSYTPLRSGSHAPTGCVATAIAQLLYYHQWPAERPKFPSYASGISIEEKGATYRWDKMTDNYRLSTVTNEQRDAVAVLMRDAGMAVSMNYKAQESSASIPNAFAALTDSFDCHTLFVDRRGYGSEEFTQLIVDELKAGRPVIYSGMGNGAHAWVCDGIDGNGMLHMNWGWGSVSNGYFDMNVLVPSTVGTGGGGGNFSYNQSIIFVNPKRPNSKPYAKNDDVMAFLLGGMVADSETGGMIVPKLSSANRSEKFNIVLHDIGNAAAVTRTWHTAIGVYDSAGNLVKVCPNQTEEGVLRANTLGTNTYTDIQIAADLSNLSPGTYQLRALCALRNEDAAPEWQKARRCEPLEIKIDENNISVTNAPIVNRLTLATPPDVLMPVYSNYQAGISLNVKNISQHIVRGELALALQKEGATEQQTILLNKTIVLNDGDTRKYVLSFNPYIANPSFETGRYKVEFLLRKTNGATTQYLAIENPFGECFVQVNGRLGGGYLEYRTMDCFVNGTKVKQESFDLESTNSLTLGIGVKNISAGTYRGAYKVSLKDTETGTLYPIGEVKGNISMGVETNNEQPSAQISFAPKAVGLQAGHLYELHLAGTFNNKEQEFWNSTTPRRYLQFTGTTNITGIATLTTPQAALQLSYSAQQGLTALCEAPIVAYALYDLNGKIVMQQQLAGSQQVLIPTTQLPRQTYILKVRTAKSVLAQKFVLP